MFKQPTYDEDRSVSIKIPWDRNTARGFGISLLITVVFLALTPIMHLTPPITRQIQYNTVPLTLLNFGDGDGTGISAGNLAESGMKRKGPDRSNPLEDANIPTKTKVSNVASQTDLASSNIKAVDELNSDSKNEIESEKGSGTKNIGASDGLTDGSGLGSRGTGKGAGYGFGDIEWGGGGNRIVLHKPLPRFPSGVNTNAVLKFKFTVMPDGTVGRIIPLQKADPRLEQAALEALRQWRFNQLRNEVVMEGIIPLQFVLR